MKTPLVLLHGWGVNSQIWDSLLPALAPSFDIHLLDLPGYGNNVDHAEAEFEYDLETVAQYVLDAAPEKAIWVGWSLGASIAMVAAATAPHRFLKLQLISPTPKFLNEPTGQSNSNWNLGMEPIPLDALAHSFEASYPKGLKKFLILQFSHHAKVKKLVRSTTEEISRLPQPSSTTLCDSLNLLAMTDLRDRASKLQVETQIIAGQHDRVIPHAASEWLADEIPNSEFVLFDSGHLPFIDDRDNYLTNLFSFVGDSEK